MNPYKSIAWAPAFARVTNSSAFPDRTMFPFSEPTPSSASPAGRAQCIDRATAGRVCGVVMTSFATKGEVMARTSAGVWLEKRISAPIFGEWWPAFTIKWSLLAPMITTPAGAARPSGSVSCSPIARIAREMSPRSPCSRFSPRRRSAPPRPRVVTAWSWPRSPRRRGRRRRCAGPRSPGGAVVRDPAKWPHPGADR